jgi:hypothetical protein
MSIKRKKKATEAEAVGFSTGVPIKKAHTIRLACLSPSVFMCMNGIPLKESKMDIIIMEIDSPKEPHIMGFRRPNRSE